MLRVFNLKKTIVIGTVIFIFLIMSLEGSAGPDWEVVTQLPTERTGFTTAVIDDEIYLIGGTLAENVKPGKRDRGPFGLSTVEVYDTQKNTWRQRADMPTPRESAQAAVVDGIIYVFGGYSAKDNKIASMKLTVRVEAYDPENGIWIRKQDMPISRLYFGLGVVGGKVYLIGGSEGIGEGHERRMDRVDIYDPASDTWMEGPKMPTRRIPGGVGVVNDRIYAIGGYGWPPDATGGPYLTVTEEYNTISRQWRKKNDMLDLRLGFAPVVVRDEIYLIGGFVVGVVSKWFATVDVYNPQTQAWSDIPALPIPLIPFNAAAVNGKIYVFGGYKEGGQHFSGVLVFDTGFRAVEANGKSFARWGELKTEPQR